MNRSLGAFLLLLAAAGPALAATCEELRASIEARIRANGVANFSVQAVELAASAPGKQVGTCDLGRKKIMYVREAPGAAASAASPSAGPARAPVITECADGRVVRDGTCKK
ncbi:MAG: DUF1161 domain-containing protein [Rubrivivax sp.]|nr:DUF1161 domain-containing protein [Rubrivivax sp.]